MDSILGAADYHVNSNEGKEPTHCARKSFVADSNKSESSRLPAKQFNNLDNDSNIKISPWTEGNTPLNSDPKIIGKNLNKFLKMETSNENVKHKKLRPRAQVACSPINEDSIHKMNALIETVKVLEEKLKSFDQVAHERDSLKDWVLKKEANLEENNSNQLQLTLKDLMIRLERMKSRVKDLTQQLSHQKDVAGSALIKFNRLSSELKEKETDYEKLLTLLNELYCVNDELKKILFVLSSSKEFYRVNCNIFAERQKSLSRRLKQANLQSFETRLLIFKSKKTSEDCLKKLQTLLSIVEYFKGVNISYQNVTPLINIYYNALRHIYANMKKYWQNILRHHSSPSQVRSGKKFLWNKRCFSDSNFSSKESELQICKPHKSVCDNDFLSMKYKVSSLCDVSNEDIESLFSVRKEVQPSVVGDLDTIYNLSAAKPSRELGAQDCHLNGKNFRQPPLKNSLINDLYHVANNVATSEQDVIKFCNFVNSLMESLAKGDFQRSNWMKLKDDNESLIKDAKNLDGKCLNIVVSGKSVTLTGFKKLDNFKNEKRSNSATELHTKAEISLKLREQIHTLSNEIAEKNCLLQNCKDQLNSIKTEIEGLYRLQLSFKENYKNESVRENLCVEEHFETSVQKPVIKEFDHQLLSLEGEFMRVKELISALKEESINNIQLIRKDPYQLRHPPSEEEKFMMILKDRELLKKNEQKLERQLSIDEAGFLKSEVLMEKMKRRKYVNALCKQSVPEETEKKLLHYLMRKVACLSKSTVIWKQLTPKDRKPGQWSDFKMSIDTSKLSRNLSHYSKKFERFPVLHQIFHKNFLQLATLFTKVEINFQKERPLLNKSVIILNLSSFEENEIPHLLKQILQKRNSAFLQIYFTGQSHLNYLCSFTSFFARELMGGTVSTSKKKLDNTIMKLATEHKLNSFIPLTEKVSENIILDSGKEQKEKTFSLETVCIQPSILSKNEENCTGCSDVPVSPAKYSVVSSKLENLEEPNSVFSDLKKPLDLIEKEIITTQTTDFCIKTLQDVSVSTCCKITSKRMIADLKPIKEELDFQTVQPKSKSSNSFEKLENVLKSEYEKNILICSLNSNKLKDTLQFREDIFFSKFSKVYPNCSSKKLVKLVVFRFAPKLKLHPYDFLYWYFYKIILANRLTRPGQKLLSFLHMIILSNSGVVRPDEKVILGRNKVKLTDTENFFEAKTISISDTFKQFMNDSPVSHLLKFHHILRVIKINLSDLHSFRFINFLLYFVREKIISKETRLWNAERYDSCFQSMGLAPEEQNNSHDFCDSITDVGSAPAPRNICWCFSNTYQKGNFVSPKPSDYRYRLEKSIEKIEGNGIMFPSDNEIPGINHDGDDLSSLIDCCGCWHCHSFQPGKEDNFNDLNSKSSSKQLAILNLRNKSIKKNWFIEISTLRSKNVKLRKEICRQTKKFTKVQNVRFLSDFEEKLKKLNQLLIEKHNDKSRVALENEYEQKIVELKDFYDRKIDDITKCHDENYKSLCKNYIDKLRSAEEIYNRNIESMEQSNIIVLKDYEFHYETKVREWQSMILQYSQNLIDLQSIVSEVKEKYRLELSNAENRYEVLIRDLYQRFNEEKVAIYVLLSETMDAFELGYKKDIEKISAKVDKEAAILHAYFVEEIERCKKRYQHNLRRQKKSYKILLEEGKKSLVKKEPQKKLLAFSEIFNFDVKSNNIDCLEDPPTLDSLNSENGKQKESFIFVDEKFVDQLSTRKFFCYKNNLEDAMEKLRLNNSFQDFELCEFLALYQEICHAILKHFQIPALKHLSPGNSLPRETSGSQSITSEMHHLRMRIIQLETILVKSCFEQLKFGDNINVSLRREESIGQVSEESGAS